VTGGVRWPFFFAGVKERAGEDERDGPSQGTFGRQKCILNWPLPIRAFQDQYKQTMINKYSNEHNHVKNPNWQEADQLAIYNHSREVELGATENNIS